MVRCTKQTLTGGPLYKTNTHWWSVVPNKHSLVVRCTKQTLTGGPLYKTNTHWWSVVQNKHSLVVRCVLGLLTQLFLWCLVHSLAAARRKPETAVQPLHHTTTKQHQFQPTQLKNTNPTTTRPSFLSVQNVLVDMYMLTDIHTNQL